MGKNNVNPNHYKVAGRERQGEDIAQARNKERHAKNLVRQRTESGARARKQGAEDDTPSPGARPTGAAKASPRVSPTRSAKVAPRQTRSPLLKTPPGAKRGHNRVPGGSKSKPLASKAPRGTAPRAGKAAAQLTAKQAAKRASVNLQGADKRGKGSTAQKRASSRHDFGRMPATKPVTGAFGKEPSPRRRPPRKG